MKKKKTILVTGCAGFIGFHLSSKILNSNNFNLVGIDNINNYYDISLKKNRLKELKKFHKFQFYKIDIKNYTSLSKLFLNFNFDYVINLAAQAGVRYSIKNPDTYFDSNIEGFYNILKLSNKYKIKHLIYASTSSVYGNSKKFPLKEFQDTSSPTSFYSASKKINEVMAYSFSSIHKLRVTGLRFFTVYGTYGRPDMAIFKFSKAVKAGKKFELFNNGNHYRDFTHVNDVVESIFKLFNKYSKKSTPYQILNICRSSTIKLSYVVKLIENYYGKKAIYKSLPMQVGDVHKTHGSHKELLKIIKRKPSVNFKTGLLEFLNWHSRYENNE